MAGHQLTGIRAEASGRALPGHPRAAPQTPSNANPAATAHADFRHAGHPASARAETRRVRTVDRYAADLVALNPPCVQLDEVRRGATGSCCGTRSSPRCLRLGPSAGARVPGARNRGRLRSRGFRPSALAPPGPSKRDHRPGYQLAGCPRPATAATSAGRLRPSQGFRLTAPSGPRWYRDDESNRTTAASMYVSGLGHWQDRVVVQVCRPLDYGDEPTAGTRRRRTHGIPATPSFSMLIATPRLPCLLMHEFVRLAKGGVQRSPGYCPPDARRAGSGRAAGRHPVKLPSLPS